MNIILTKDLVKEIQEYLRENQLLDDSSIELYYQLNEQIQANKKLGRGL